MSVYKGEHMVAGGSVDTHFVRKPAWSQAVAVTVAQLQAGYTVPNDGILVGYIHTVSASTLRTINVNNVPVAVAYGTAADISIGQFQVEVNANDVVTYPAGTVTSSSIHFVPFEDSTISDVEVVTPEYIRNQNILSDWEDITVPAAGYTAPYDGFVSVSNAVATGKTGLAAILVNGVSCNSWRVLPTDTTIQANTLSCSAPIKKGDIVTVIGVDIGATKARFYKLRDYRGR